MEEPDSVLGDGGQVGADRGELLGFGRVRRQPDTFWRSFTIRTSRSAALLSNGTRASRVNRKWSLCLSSSRRASALWSLSRLVARAAVRRVPRRAAERNSCLASPILAGVEVAQGVVAGERLIDQAFHGSNAVKEHRFGLLRRGEGSFMRTGQSTDSSRPHRT